MINPQFLRRIFKTIEKALSSPHNTLKQREKPAQTLQKIGTKTAHKNNEQTLQQVNANLLLNRPEQVLIMREMLQLPRDLREILTLLLSQNKKINPDLIKKLLETNSKEVIGRLIRLIQQTPQNTQNHEQLKQLIGLLNRIVPPGESTPQEVITQFLLLYLPWLPLLEHQKIEVAFEKKKARPPVDDTVAMVIYISTINLGRFKVIIFVDKNNSLDILIQNIEGKDSKILSNILKKIKSGIKKESITAETHMTVVKQKNFEKSEFRKITISQVNNISPLVLIAAQKIAQIIFEFDEKMSLLEKREQSVKD